MSEQRVLFGNWRPTNYPWIPNNTELWDQTSFDSELFKQLFNREPESNEDVEGLTKAGSIVLSVLSMSTPPTDITNDEFDLMLKASEMIQKSDLSMGFAISMVIANIIEVNPQCRKFLEKPKEI